MKCPPFSTKIFTSIEVYTGMLRAALSLTHEAYVTTKNKLSWFSSLERHPCKVHNNSLKQARTKPFSPVDHKTNPLVTLEF